MSESPLAGEIPTWTVGDRMGKALSHANLSVAVMSEYLDIHRNTISAYINDRATPPRQTMLLWAMRTGVSLEWLENGAGSPPTPTPPPSGPRKRDEQALRRLADRKRGRRGNGQVSGTYLPRDPVAA